MGMERRRWLNPTQPQTLQIGVMLLYVNAALTIITGGIFSLIGIIIAAAEAAGGFGIANERKWGYIVGVAAAILPLAWVVYLLLNGASLAVGFGLIGLVFQIALVALLLHPQSREYQRIWFK
jgi:hypothetical protein